MGTSTNPAGPLSVLLCVSWAAAGLIPDTSIRDSLKNSLNTRAGPLWSYAVIGDSWAAGIAYNPESTYDNNRDQCLRSSEAHGPQLEEDDSWKGAFSSELRDAACSGSGLGDIAIGRNEMESVGKPELIIMTSGGNNAGFAPIVDPCIYHSDFRHNYGPAFADDPDGLRRAFNDRVAKINDLYRRVIEDNFAQKARYIDIDSRFAGHRFCEPGASHLQQFVRDTRADSVWLWNLNYFGSFLSDDDVDPGTDGNVTEQQADELFPNPGVTAWSGSGGDNTVSAGWRQRPFHPRYTGHRGIKDAIIAQLEIDGLPREKSEINQQNTASASSSSPEQTSASTPKPTPPTPPTDFTHGRCSFHLIEAETCGPDDSNLFARIRLFDDTGMLILGETDGYDEGPGDPINSDAPLRFKHRLPHDLVVVGEHQGDYVQFNYNGLRWTSEDAEGDGNCDSGRWDPRGGPSCSSNTELNGLSKAA
ncbi:MAG: hypothetical protein Q9174_006152, partial [Haloplaca sp. 1 TL-2023]